MSEESKLHHPWLVAVWPGMGHVALSAGYYLMAKLGMHQFAEFSARELFEVDHVEVKDGLIRSGRMPRNRLFVWPDAHERHDIIVFIGEAQPPLGKYAFCHQLVDYALELGIERVFTFAAMATQMHPENEARVFAAATDEETLAELQRWPLELLTDGSIGGLNGVVLGVAAERGIPGACLLGEMPHFFAQLPFPKASLAVLEVFSNFAGIDLDLIELKQQAQDTEQKLGEVLGRIEEAMRQREQHETEEAGEEYRPIGLQGVTIEDQRRIERLFELAQQDRAKAYELKQLLDEVDAFGEYEDRFLDLFRKTD